MKGFEGNNMGAMRKKKNGRVSRDFIGLRTWEETASPQEKALKEKAIEFDRLYFDDFNFEPNSITGKVYDFARIENCPPQVLNQNRLYECTPTVIKDCRFHVREIGGDIIGNCNGWDIIIDPSCVDRPEIVLHEMIHLRINAMHDSYREILTICLYKGLKKELKKDIKNFEEMILDHATAVAADYNPNLWHHGTLFFSKALTSTKGLISTLAQCMGMNGDRRLHFRKNERLYCRGNETRNRRKVSAGGIGCDL
jgi:hypothetical protein